MDTSTNHETMEANQAKRNDYVYSNDALSVISPSNSNPSQKPEKMETCWESLPKMLSKRSKFSSAVHNDKLYIFGGNVPNRRSIPHGSKSSSVEMYDPKTNTWTQLPNMKFARCESSSAVVGENIYVIGGDTFSVSKRGEVFNTRTKTWSVMPDLIRKREKHNSVAVGDKIYVFGGKRCKVTEVYDTVEKTWNIADGELNDVRYSFASVAVENKIYAIGGMKEFFGKNDQIDKYHRYLGTVEVYDIEQGKWYVSKAKLRNRRCGCSAVVVGSTIQLLGGYDEKAYITSIESFDIIKQEWTGSTIPPSKVQRKFCAALMLTEQRYLVVAGGINDSNKLLNSVEKLDTHVKKSDIPIINKFTNVVAKLENPPCLNETHTKRKSDSSISQVSPRSTRARIASATKRGSDDDIIPFKNSSVAKMFDGELYYGHVVCFDDKERLFTVEYEDGDSEELSFAELNKAIRYYENSQETEKLDMTTSRKQPKLENSNSEVVHETEEPQDLIVLGAELTNLREIMDAKKRTVCKLEEDKFGETQSGPLQNRIEKLKHCEMEDLEIDFFGDVQRGEIKERVKNLKSLLRI